MVNNSTKYQQNNNHLSHALTEHKKGHYIVLRHPPPFTNRIYIKNKIPPPYLINRIAPLGVYCLFVCLFDGVSTIAQLYRSSLFYL